MSAPVVTDDLDRHHVAAGRLRDAVLEVITYAHSGGLSQSTTQELAELVARLDGLRIDLEGRSGEEPAPRDMPLYRSLDALSVLDERDEEDA